MGPPKPYIGSWASIWGMNFMVLKALKASSLYD